MRLIDADAAIKDANLNYGGVYDAVLVKRFLDRKPTVLFFGSDSDGCEDCNKQYCITCTYCGISDGYEPCISCDETHQNYRPTNYCPECGKKLWKEN